MSHKPIFSKKRILIISPEPWGGSSVSKHHYATTLAGLGNEIWFLGTRPGVVDPKNLPDRVKLLQMPPLPKGLSKWPAFLRKWYHKHLGKKLERQAGTSFDVVWSFDTSVLYDLDQLAPKALRILHVVDLNQDFHWREAAASADVCIGSTTAIVEKLSTVNPKTLKLGHGLAPEEEGEIQLEPGQKHAVYAGNLSIPYLDWPRLLNLVKSYPEVRFHFFGDDGSGNLGSGTVSEKVEELRSLPNADLEGVVPPSWLPGIYRQADVLFLCYRTDERKQVANPHKVLEYLSSGTPILSTELEEYLDIPELIRMEDDEEKYIKAFGDLLNERNPSLPPRRRSYAWARSYSARIQTVERYLQHLKHD